MFKILFVEIFFLCYYWTRLRKNSKNRHHLNRTRRRSQIHVSQSLFATSLVRFWTHRTRYTYSLTSTYIYSTCTQSERDDDEKWNRFMDSTTAKREEKNISSRVKLREWTIQYTISTASEREREREREPKIREPLRLWEYLCVGGSRSVVLCTFERHG